MRHRAKGRQLSRTSSHRRALLNNMATSLFEHGRVITTEAKAKELRPFAEKLITLARRGDLHARRLVGAADQGSRDPLPPLQRDRSAVRRPPGRLHPNPQARPPRRRRGGHRPDRAALRVRPSPPLRNKKGDPGVPFFLTAVPAGSDAGGAALGALVIRLLFRHCVQTRTRLGAPSTSTRTVCRFGYQRRLVRLLAWLTLLPVTGPLPHTVHTRAISSIPR